MDHRKFSFDFLKDSIDGWLTGEEGRVLRELARGKVVIEVGSWHGLSTACLAWDALRVYAIDPHLQRAGISGERSTLASLCRTLHKYTRPGVVIPLVGTTAEVAPALADRVADLIFVDGDHEHAADDIRMLERCLKPGGTWAFHDYDFPPWPLVTRDVDALAKRLGRPVEKTDTLAVVRA